MNVHLIYYNRDMLYAMKRDLTASAKPLRMAFQADRIRYSGGRNIDFIFGQNEHEYVDFLNSAIAESVYEDIVKAFERNDPYMELDVSRLQLEL